MLRAALIALTAAGVLLPTLGLFSPRARSITPLTNRRAQTCDVSLKDSLGRCPAPVRTPTSSSVSGGSGFSSGSSGGGGK